MAHTFLGQVAKHYAEHNNLEDMAFVFPNRRSSQQFERELKELVPLNTLMPRTMSLNDFVDHIMRDSHLITASPIESLFTAYRAYKMALGDSASDFDKFAYWGQLIVSDFNDVDINLVDAHQLYKNLYEQREIASNYIDDPSLIKAIRSVFNIDIEVDSDNMWKNNEPVKKEEPSSQGQKVRKNYTTLWENMHTIYDNYSTMLASNGLTTQGKLYRAAVEKIQSNAYDIADLGFSRIVIVGHDTLDNSVLAIFNKLAKRKDMVDFWWDTASPAIYHDNNPARYILKLAEKFAPVEKIAKLETTKPGDHSKKADKFPVIEVHDVPSSIGQAKCVFEDLTGTEVDMEKLNKRAIILPDESLLEPLLNSIPVEIPGEDGINITMGYQLRKSNIATLMHLVAVANKHITNNKETNGYSFYREDVLNILSHPIIKTAYSGEVMKISAMISCMHEYNIPEETFTTTALAPLFSTKCHKMEKWDDVSQFISGLESFCNNLCDNIKAHLHEPTVAVEEADNEAIELDEPSTLTLQEAFIHSYITVLEQLGIAIDKIKALETEVQDNGKTDSTTLLPVNNVTLFHLLKRMTSGSIVAFGGHSGQGLQVMGMLETRCLDYADLHLLSANEGTIPRRNALQTLIPNNLREAFGMSTPTVIDGIEAYRFYRLISRAEKVTLYYDTSNEGASEPTRYIEQLDKVFHCHIKRYKRTASVTNMAELDITIDDLALKENLRERYTTGELNYHKSLSASAINKYINCPLEFYLRHVQGLAEDNGPEDLMSTGTFGNIVHDTLMDFYRSKQQSDNQTFTVNDIESFMKNGLDKVLVKNINIHFMKRTDEAKWDTPISGQAVIIYDTLKRQVMNALNNDIQAITTYKDTGISIVECEETHFVCLDLKGTRFNFTFKADRIDRIGDTLRIIDYKTGSDEIVTSTIDDIFNTDLPHRPKVFLQLLLYTMALIQCAEGKSEDAMILRKRLEGIKYIEPYVYKLTQGDTMGAFVDDWQIKLDIDDVKNQSGEFLNYILPKMGEKISGIWTLPFKQCEGERKECTYCAYKDFCRREK